MARRPRGVPDRLLVHVRARAARGGRAGAPHRAGRATCRCTARRRLPAGRALRRPAGRLDAPDDAGPGGPRDRITAPLPAVHGAPVHIGDPAALGIADLAAPDYGDPSSSATGEVPVFWACGVTPQAVAAGEQARAHDHPRPGPHVRHRPSQTTARRSARTGEPVPPPRASAAGRRTRTRARRRAASSSRKSDSMMWMPAWTIRIVWPGSEPRSGSTVVRDVPGDVVGADRERPALGQPARGLGGDAARRQVGGRGRRTARPSPAARARRRRRAARPRRRRAPARRGHRMRRRHRAPTSSSTPRRDDRRHGVDPERGEAGRRLHRAGRPRPRRA